MVAQDFTTLLLLFVLLVLLDADVSVVRAQRPYECQKLDSLVYCRNSSRIQVTKDKDDYRVRLCSSSDQCMSDGVPGGMNLRIRCRDVCDVCMSFPGSGQNDCKDDRDCEEEVDRFFDEYCSSANAAATTFEQQLATVATECTPTGYSKVGGQVSPAEQILQTATGGSSSSLRSIVVALAALLGLSVLLLAVVTIGWVCTCVSVRKRGKMDSEMIESTEQNRTAFGSRLRRTCDDDDNYEERYFKNPTYEGASNKSATLNSTATYETVNLSDSTKITIENEQTYATVPDKQWKADGAYIF